MTSLPAGGLGGTTARANEVSLRPFLAQLDTTERRLAGKGWLEAAQAEHASVASFNRFSLQLLAVGAPPGLLQATQQAALEEIRHTRLCFAIASAYLGEPLGPGPLPLSEDIFSGFDLRALACGTVEEGCIGETLAALEAGAARERAEPPMVRDALEVIERDEAAHARLAFQAVRWALGQAPSLREAVRRSYLDTLDRHLHEPRGQLRGIADLARHGLLPEGERQRVRKQAIAQVLRPALDQLLA